MKLDKLFVNARIVTHESSFPGFIGTSGGRISVIGGVPGEIEAEERIDLGGRFLIPGVIDPHVHCQDPGLTDREDLEHASAAAAVGGITTILSHPLNEPAAVDSDRYQYTLSCYEGRSYIDYGLHGGAVADNLEQVNELWEKTGATALKIFMCDAGDDFPYLKDDMLLRHLRQIKKLGGLALFHAENQELIQWNETRMKALGRTDPYAYLESRPLEGELEAIGRAIFFLEQTGAAGIILHVGSAQGLRLIHAAKQRGVKVYAETCPHYLTFVDEDIGRLGPCLKFAPPMRDETNRQELWRLLGQGYVDTIGSDHCPHRKDESEAGLKNIWAAPNGIPGLEVFLPVLLDGVAHGRLTMRQLVRLTSFQTARLYGLYPRKGGLLPGADADFTILDMDISTCFSEQRRQSKCEFSPYFGMEFTGWPVMTVVRGEVVMRDGQLTGRLGYGRYIPRPKAVP